MRKNFLLLFLLTLLPLAGWADDPQLSDLTGNIGVQLSTTMTKEYGDADPVYLKSTDFVIISNTSENQDLTEADLVNVLKFKRKQGQESNERGTYDFEVTVNAESAFATANPDLTIVATNTGRITITPKTLTNAMIGDITGAPFTFDNTAKTPTPVVSYVKNPEAPQANQVTVTLVAGTHFTFDYADNIHAGTAKVLIKALDPNYADPGTQANPFAYKEFTIDPKAIAADKLSIEYDDEYTYTGLAIAPELTVKDMSLNGGTPLSATTDYTVTYSDDHTNYTEHEGDTYLKVTAKDGGDYTFTAVQKNFTINKHALTIAIKAGQKKVFGTAADPALEVVYGTGENGFVGEETAANQVAAGKFVAPTLARVAGENAGVYAISITNAEEVIAGAKNYAVTITPGTVNFSIQPKDLSEDATVTLTNKEGDDYIYNSEEHFKDVTVKVNNVAIEATNYIVETTKNVNAGDAEVKVTFIGNYKGSKTETFAIAKAEITVVPTVAKKNYGAGDPNLAYTLKVGNETVANTVLNGTVNLQREEGETVGTYKIWFKEYEATEAQLAADNYAIVNTATKETEVAANRTALFTILGSAGTLYLKFKEGTTATKEYGAANPEWSIDDLEVDNTVQGGLVPEDWDAIKYSFGDPVFGIESEDVDDNDENFVSVTNQLASPIYPTVVVGTLPFTISPKEIALTVANQQITYGDDIDQFDEDHQDAFAIAAGELAAADIETGKAVLDVRLAVANLGTYGPGAVAERVITATIRNTNYVLAAEGNTWGNLTVNAEIPALALDDSKDDNLIKINAYNNKAANVTIKFSQRDAHRGYGEDEDETYPWSAGQWTTLVLPFDISVAKLSEAFGYAIVNVIDPSKAKGNGTSAEFYGTLTMKGGNGSEEVLKANKPILIKIADDIEDRYVEDAEHNKYYYVVDFGQQTIVAPAAQSVDAGLGAQFVGTYVEKTVTKADDAKIWFMNGNENGWQYIGSSSNATWTIAPFEAYIDMNTLDAREMVFYFEDIDGSVTAIKGVDVDNRNNRNVEGMYNLNGMKLNSVPTQKGIYIVNGKKVVIK